MNLKSKVRNQAVGNRGSLNDLNPNDQGNPADLDDKKNISNVNFYQSILLIVD
jgi:hypothetical protein